jgi:hypothetical protein
MFGASRWLDAEAAIGSSAATAAATRQEELRFMGIPCEEVIGTAGNTRG